MTTNDLYAENGADFICQVRNLRIEEKRRNPNGTYTPKYFIFECDVRLVSHGFYYLNINDSPVKIQVVDNGVSVVSAIGV